MSERRRSWVQIALDEIRAQGIEGCVLLDGTLWVHARGCLRVGRCKVTELKLSDLQASARARRARAAARRRSWVQIALDEIRAQGIEGCVLLDGTLWVHARGCLRVGRCKVTELKLSDLQASARARRRKKATWQ